MKHLAYTEVPMIGFGIMDNSVMLHAGNTIDLTLGVTFGLSTLASAACGPDTEKTFHQKNEITTQRGCMI
eukprot:6464521-Amphidinium_carterae.2